MRVGGAAMGESGEITRSVLETRAKIITPSHSQSPRTKAKVRQPRRLIGKQSIHLKHGVGGEITVNRAQSIAGGKSDKTEVVLLQAQREKEGCSGRTAGGR